MPCLPLTRPPKGRSAGINATLAHAPKTQASLFSFKSPEKETGARPGRMSVTFRRAPCWCSGYFLRLDVVSLSPPLPRSRYAVGSQGKRGEGCDRNERGQGGDMREGGKILSCNLSFFLHSYCLGLGPGHPYVSRACILLPSAFALTVAAGEANRPLLLPWS